MVNRIVICGETQCQQFAEATLIADHLDKHLPNFFYDRVEKSVLEWKSWLTKTNVKNKWHHDGSPLIWKELLIKGSKPYYIGGTSEFLEYCHAFYDLDVFLSSHVFRDLIKNLAQYRKRVMDDEENPIIAKSKKVIVAGTEKAPKNDFTVCIYGAAYPLAMHLISGLLEMSYQGKYISKIYIYDSECSPAFMDAVEAECSFIGTNQPGRVVKYVDKIGNALTNSDILIMLHHVPFEEDMSIGHWLAENENLMHELAMMINACASRSMYILFGNLGPVCYNATVLMNSVTANQKNIVVVTSGLGLDTLSAVSDIAEVPIRNLYCPPVWGFVGINHIVDIRTLLHKYNSFQPYDRFMKVQNSTLSIGSVTPEVREMQYLMHFDTDLWSKVAEKKERMPKDQVHLFKGVAILNVVKLWLFNPDPKIIVNLGIRCDGSFGLTFEGAFSQPCSFKNDRWQPASDYMTPKDPFVTLSYLEEMANRVMRMTREDLPKIVPYTPCICKKIISKKKEVWGIGDDAKRKQPKKKSKKK